ncbi:MAG: sulfatase, partial [Pedosphaera sp.]|nr:sulfatase [Pedosphaera sp.]
MNRFYIFFSSIFLFATLEGKQPNFILFITDDISWDDLGCYGSKVAKTPHLDQMANEGMLFHGAYLSISSCSPSRCSIISGRYPHNTGAAELHTELPADQPVFPEALQVAGYYTAISGKHHMGKAVNRGFDKVSGGKGPSKSADWVPMLQERPKDKPFFFWFASSDAHRGWALNGKAPLYKPEDIEVPPYLYDGPVTRKDLAEYMHEVSRTDYYMGQLRAELKRQGIEKDTYIIYMTDNGRPFPRCKTRLYDSGIRTPFLIARPGTIAPSETHSLISSIDISATILELAGAKKDKRIQGVSFAPILENPKVTVRDYVFAEHNWHVYQAHERMVRFGNFLYIRNNFPNQPNLSYESDDHYPAGLELWQAHAAGKTNPKQYQLFANPCPPEELFQVNEDPHQLKNLADDPKHAKTLKQARALLTEWVKQTGDSIPANPTPNRHDPPRIEDGKILPPGKAKTRNPHAEMPGFSNSATKINHPGRSRE